MYMYEIIKKIFSSISKVEEFRFNNQISSSDLTGWFLGFIGGLIIFILIQRMQNTMQRHQVIKDVENSINNIFSSNIALSRKTKKVWFTIKKDKTKVIKENGVSIRTILHDKTSWNIYCEKDDFTCVIKDKKYIKIREYEDYEEFISTQALHEILIMFRRIEKLYKDRILKDIDIADLWRELIPFGVYGRLEFFAHYFGQEDVRVIAYVIFITLMACDKYNIERGMNYFRSYYIRSEKIHKYFYKNARFRLREKIIRMFKFENIVYK